VLVVTPWVAGACGGSELGIEGPSEAGTNVDAASTLDVGLDVASALDGTLDATAETDASSSSACIPGQSVACVGPGGCSSNQVCSADGASFGPSGASYGPCDT
jgi:hypothetical protein